MIATTSTRKKHGNSTANRIPFLRKSTARSLSPMRQELDSRNSKSKSKQSEGNSGAQKCNKEKQQQYTQESRCENNDQESDQSMISHEEQHEIVEYGEQNQSTEFLQRYRKETWSYISNAYLTEREVRHSVISGAVTTSLAEDIFFLIDVQLKVLHEFLVSRSLLCTDTGEEIVVDSILSTFRYLWSEQTRHREKFLGSVESCCAAANDFARMADRLEQLIKIIEIKYPHLDWSAFDMDGRTNVLHREANDLAAILSNDAIFAAQTAHTFVMQAIEQSSVKDELFTRDWEDKYTHNEVVIGMVRIFEDYANDIQNFLVNDFLYYKVVTALARSTACFYLRQIILKATRVRNGNSKRHKLNPRFQLNLSHEDRMHQMPFASPSRALCRIMYDIQILQTYFHKISKSCDVLTRDIATELSVLEIVHEFMSLAVSQSDIESLQEFIIVMHKQTGANIAVTKHMLSDLWYLTSPTRDRNLINKAVKNVNTELQIVSDRIGENTLSTRYMDLNRVDVMLKNFYEDQIWQAKLSKWAPCLKA